MSTRLKDAWNLNMSRSAAGVFGSNANEWLTGEMVYKVFQMCFECRYDNLNMRQALESIPLSPKHAEGALAAAVTFATKAAEASNADPVDATTGGKTTIEGRERAATASYARWHVQSLTSKKEIFVQLKVEQPFLLMHLVGLKCC